MSDAVVAEVTEDTGVSGPTPASRVPLLDEILGIWREVLGNDQLTADDDFFGTGGDSLLAAAMATTIRERMGIQISLRTVLLASTAATLTAELTVAAG